MNGKWKMGIYERLERMCLKISCEYKPHCYYKTNTVDSAVHKFSSSHLHYRKEYPGTQNKILFKAQAPKSLMRKGNSMMSLNYFPFLLFQRYIPCRHTADRLKGPLITPQRAVYSFFFFFFIHYTLGVHRGGIDFPKSEKVT